ncbi:MAG TPA: hypothetical protein VJP84_13765 [Steroidobacteraceae bacterium]|jgi:hypothetical protein|nr:hypothetical protein [Steroidobacteraceae bacterium]
MHRLSNALLALPLLLLGTLAQAQTAGTISFTANQTSATGSLTPKLTWSTTPVASSCTASGAWSGTKFASGSETLATITASKSYTLTCAWGNGTATINWAAPTQNTNGTRLTDLKGFKIVYGKSATSLTYSQSVNSATATNATVAALGSGTWYFAVRAVNNAGAESDNSAVVSRTINAATAAKTVNITINSTGTTDVWVTTSTAVYDVLMQNGVRVLGRQVGTVPLNTRCQTYYKVGTNYYKINETKIKVTTKPRSAQMVARCAKQS